MKLECVRINWIEAPRNLIEFLFDPVARPLKDGDASQEEIPLVRVGDGTCVIDVE